MSIADKRPAKTLGIFVGEDNWTFFSEIYTDLSSQFKTQVFKRRHLSTPVLSGRLNRWRFLRDIQVMLKRNEVCFFEWASDLLAVASQMPRRCRVITRLHSFELYEWAPKVNWNAVDRIIVLSEAMRLMFAELYPEQAQKLIVIHNGCSLDKFGFSPEKEFTFSLGMLSTITPIKRIYEVVLMLNELANLGYPATLRIAGNPDNDERYAVAIHRLVKKLNMQDRVFFDGFIHDTPAWLHKIDVLISNSFWEGQQTALIEALASGCYCLAHFWNGVDEMLPADQIYVTEKELMKKVIAYSELPEAKKTALRTQMRRCAQDMFDINSTKEKILQVIKQEYARSGSI